MTAPPAPYVPLLTVGDAVPAVALVDQRGRPFSFATTDGRTTLLAFVYTHCADARFCALTAAEFGAMQRSVRGTPIRLVTLTLDPTRDSPRALARYGALFRADPAVWSLVTGPPTTVDELVARFGITVTHPRPDLLVHSEAAIVIDAHGRVARIVDGATWSSQDVLGAARDVAALPSSPLHAFRLWLADGVGVLCGGAARTSWTVGGSLVLIAALIALFGTFFIRAFRAAPTRP